MIAAWMLVSAVLGVVIALGALALDGAARAAHRAVRWAWAGAICAVVLLTMLLPLRRAGEGATFRISGMASVTTGTAQPVANTPLALRVLDSVRSALDAPSARLVRVAARAVSPAADHWLFAGWVACSLALLVLGAYVLWRLLDARRSWPIELLHGERVHVAPTAGPAVLGFVRGAIVVPCWLSECTPEVQQVVLAHEREHLRARDPLLLALGAAAVILLPWNPALWWMLARLRLAVELDCDRRVLAAGVGARDYGTLLIDLAGRTARVPLGVPLVGLTMLAERTTHLERRIVAMSAPRPHHTALRIAAGSLVALVAALAACESRLPTEADVTDMNVASAQRAAAKVGIMDGSDSLTTYYIDGYIAGAEAAHALSRDRIASVRVQGDTANRAKGSVWIVTRAAGVGAASRSSADSSAGGRVHVKLDLGRRATFAGLYVVDGKRADQKEFAALHLDPRDIASIDVIKGPSATALYPNDPAAAQGVIKITTKHGTR